ncbi:MAG: protein kinase, partial [Chitinivibrionales bacterium]|nr:protein kinase [Chitinivibrionales bacterium]
MVGCTAGRPAGTVVHRRTGTLLERQNRQLVGCALGLSAGTHAVGGRQPRGHIDGVGTMSGEPSPQDKRPQATPPEQLPGAPEPREYIGPYRVVRYIGGGGMGDVWLAADEHGNEVAIKLLSISRLGQKSAVERFMREGRTLSRLQHRNICHIYGIESSGGRHYLVMEYVKGAALSRLLRFLAAPSSDATTKSSRSGHEELSTIIDEVEQSTSAVGDWNTARPVVTTEPSHVLPLQQTLSIVTKLCDAVQYAHERGVFHRDIKPSNVIIRRDGEPVLLDFGVAKLADEADLTMPGQLFGTMEYMAPEQAQSPKEVDERADVYSIGAI